MNKFNSVSMALLVVSVLLMMAVDRVSARNWIISGHDSRIRFDHGCDFYGSDLSRFYTNSWSDCAHECFNMPICTHFAHFKDTCYIKLILGGQRESFKENCVCGFISGRSRQRI